MLFTREGRGGARQVETRGLIATAFTHRDSRAGDPDLHTHVAVSNKVQTLQGKWLAIYGKVLHEHIVAASETYNTAPELRLTETLGVRFVERAGLSTGSTTGKSKRPVREIVGVDTALCQQWSRRRTDITVRQGELAREFRQVHGRPPTQIESVVLAQQANPETREAKHEPRSYADQRRTRLAEAAEVLGSEQAVSAMISDVVSRRRSAPPDPLVRITVDWTNEIAERVITELEAHRATRRTQHVKAEVQRQLRGVALPIDRAGQVAQFVADDVVSHSVNLTPDADPIADPTALRRSDGTSVYRHTGTDHYTSQRLLDAERRIVAIAGPVGGAARTVDEVAWSVLVARLHDVPLNRGREALVTAMATSGRRVQLAPAPAGSGKTTAMLVLAATWTARGGNAVGLAPSAAAAAALAEATGMPCETLAKLDHDLAHSPGSALVASIQPGTLVVIDEAGMADTLTLDRVIAYAAARDAVVRLIGDDQQLAAVGAGGVLHDIVTTHGALRLDELVRFADPAEATASLDLRDGDNAALGFYLDHERVHVGDVDGCADDLLDTWQRERAAGRDCVMLAPTRDLVRQLNLRAQRARDLRGPSVRLSDECDARVGDVVITRRNDRRLGISGSDWVKNGDRWIITATKDGRLSVQHRDSGLHTMLPAEYVAEHVELGYASTVHTAQGLTTDVMHGIVTGQETRQTLYTMLTRGRIENHVHVVLTEANDDHALPSPRLDRARTATELLEGIVARDGATASATTTRAVAASPETQLKTAVARYADALALAASKLHVDLEEAPVGPLPGLPVSTPTGRASGPGSVPRRPRPSRLHPHHPGSRPRHLDTARVGAPARRRTHPRPPRRPRRLEGGPRSQGQRPHDGRSNSEQRRRGVVPPPPHAHDQRPLRRSTQGLGGAHRPVRRHAR
ncbi:MobF family relaxase [Nocardioides sp. B-3]|uniref:MobF family relaxase n=1 Tax=Nocardioides sp. B-3 TaxID=2895565 RepID=UPI00220490AA|nr:AAA family ATPase [Nocardioides sp. B-3]